MKVADGEPNPLRAAAMKRHLLRAAGRVVMTADGTVAKASQINARFRRNFGILSGTGMAIRFGWLSSYSLRVLFQAACRVRPLHPGHANCNDITDNAITAIGSSKPFRAANSLNS